MGDLLKYLKDPEGSLLLSQSVFFFSTWDIEEREERRKLLYPYHMPRHISSNFNNKLVIADCDFPFATGKPH